MTDSRSVPMNHGNWQATHHSASAAAALVSDPAIQAEGQILSVSALGVEISDRFGFLDIGARVQIFGQAGHQVGGQGSRNDAPLLAEIVSIGVASARALVFGSCSGIRRGDRVVFSSSLDDIRPSRQWLGRVIDGLGRPVDGLGGLSAGRIAIGVKNTPPPAAMRARLGERIDFGIKALNAFTPAQQGQRLGIFSGSGVGKSALLGMLARHTDCDVRIIALIGERGREVREFIENDLGKHGLANSIVIVATADEPALMRREAGFLAMTLAEHFRDQGSHVLCLMDSVTRIAMAQREIGLAAGEPPAARGFTPSVFSLLPSLLERAGPGWDSERSNSNKAGHITGIFTVLVEGDDPDEPVSDHCRAILDGHIVLDRRIAERGRFPAVNILKSLSRTAGSILSDQEGAAYSKARQLAALYEDMGDLIRIGAYQQGANPQVDEAIAFCADLEKFLTQNRHNSVRLNENEQSLSALVGQFVHSGTTQAGIKREEASPWDHQTVLQNQPLNY